MSIIDRLTIALIAIIGLHFAIMYFDEFLDAAHDCIEWIRAIVTRLLNRS